MTLGLGSSRLARSFHRRGFNLRRNGYGVCCVFHNGLAFVTVNVQKFAGQQTFSVELLDRSSPAFFAELSRQMQFAYAKATNARVSTVIAAAATDGGNRTMSAANLLDFISDAAVDIYKETLGFATNVVVSPEQWGAIMGLIDGSNRPVYVQTINPQNASANLTPTGVRGNVHGLNLYVSRSLSGVGDGTIIVLNPESYTCAVLSLC